MKKWMMMLVAAMAMMSFGCAKNDCERATDIILDAQETYCKDHKSCSNCKCILDPKASGCSTFSDAKDKKEREDAACEGETLKGAQECLKNEKTCTDTILLGLRSSCGDNSWIPGYPY
ncbi:MAG: hypothetical protein FWD46_00035 [Cystobacterineae bacterium]|nr:hypothetical protein [Cystobacterineae bacterium]